MPDTFRLVWIRIALCGPLSADDVHEFAIAGIRDALLDIGAIEYDADGLIIAAFSFLNNSFVVTWNDVYSKIQGPFFDVDNPVDNSSNHVDNPVDKSIFSDDIRSSSSNVVEISKNGVNDENITLKNPAKKPRGRPRGKAPTDDAEFDAFWSAYPKDASKKSALDVWKRIRAASKDWPALYAAIMAGLFHAKASRQWNAENGIYVPEAHRWLSKEKWSDRLPAAAVVRFDIENYFYDAPQSPPRAPRDESGDTRPMNPRPPATSPEGRTDTNQTDVLFANLTASPEYVELAIKRIELEIDDRMAPDGILVDLVDIELIRRDGAGRLRLRGDNALIGFVSVLSVQGRYTWRIGRRPISRDDLELELSLREDEYSALYDKYVREEGEQ